MSVCSTVPAGPHQRRYPLRPRAPVSHEAPPSPSDAMVAYPWFRCTLRRDLPFLEQIYKRICDEYRRAGRCPHDPWAVNDCGFTIGQACRLGLGTFEWTDSHPMHLISRMPGVYTLWIGLDTNDGPLNQKSLVELWSDDMCEGPEDMGYLLDTKRGTHGVALQTITLEWFYALRQLYYLSTVSSSTTTTAHKSTFHYWCFLFGLSKQSVASASLHRSDVSVSWFIVKRHTSSD